MTAAARRSAYGLRPEGLTGRIPIAEFAATVTTVVSLVLYTLAQAPERVVSASLGVTAP